MFKLRILLLITALILLISACSRESYIIKQIDKANYCNTAEDCIEISGDCAFGCYVYINKAEESMIKNLIDSFDSQYICDCQPSADSLKCVENKCVAEFYPE